MRCKILCLVLASWLGISLSLSSANAQAIETSQANTPPSIQTVRYLPWPVYEGEQEKSLIIVKWTSQIFRFDRPISRAAVSNPEICDIVPLSKQEILIYAKETGHINLLVWDETYNIATFDIQSTIDIRKLHRVLKNIDPRSRLRIVPFEGTFFVDGTAETALKVKQITDTILALDKRAASFVKIREPKQILLEVRFAEVNRKAEKGYGLDVDLITDRFYRLYSAYGQTGAVPRKDSPLFTTETGKGFRPTSFGERRRDGVVDFLPLFAPTGTDDVNLGGSYVSRNTALQTFLRWLEQKNILKIIARPNLLAKDGEQASFLVGGETPVIVSNTNGVTVNYREFGTKLVFTPEIGDASVIHLKTETEVSELDFSSTVTVSGTTVPTIIKRNHQNVSELRDNETLVIGGMITQRINRVKRGFPILGEIPFLDRFFSREKFTRADVELLITVTPHIVKPLKLGEEKVFYNPREVRRATRAIYPPYPESQGDLINKLFTQDEGYQSFTGRDGEETVKKEIKPAVKKPEEKKIQVPPKPKKASPLTAKPKPIQESKVLSLAISPPPTGSSKPT